MSCEVRRPEVATVPLQERGNCLGGSATVKAVFTLSGDPFEGRRERRVFEERTDRGGGAGPELDVWPTAITTPPPSW